MTGFAALPAESVAVTTSVALSERVRLSAFFALLVSLTGTVSLPPPDDDALPLPIATTFLPSFSFFAVLASIWSSA